MAVASQQRMILVRASVESADDASLSAENYKFKIGFGFGSLLRPPEIQCVDTVLWLLLFLSPQIDSGMNFVGDDVVPREGEFRLEQYRQNYACGVDTRCFFLAAYVITLPAFCRAMEIASSLGMVSTLPNFLEDCYELLHLKSMDYEDVILLLNVGGLQVIAPPIAVFVGFHANVNATKTLQTFLLPRPPEDHLSDFSNTFQSHGGSWFAYAIEFGLKILLSYGYSSHCLYSQDYKLGFLCRSMMMQKNWTKSRLFLSLLQSQILVLLNFTRDVKQLRAVGLCYTSLGFLFELLPWNPADHHPHIFSSRIAHAQGECWSAHAFEFLWVNKLWVVLVYFDEQQTVNQFQYCLKLPFVLLRRDFHAESQAETKLRKFTLELLEELNLRLSQATRDLPRDVIELLLQQFLPQVHLQRQSRYCRSIKHLLLARSGWFRSILDFLHCSLPRPPEDLSGFG